MTETLEYRARDGSEKSCPFCNGLVALILLPDRKRIGHTHPSCATFKTLDADDFLAALAGKLEPSS